MNYLSVTLAKQQCMSQAIEEQSKGCHSLRQIISSDLLHIDEIIQSGVIPQLVKFLDHNEHQTTVNETLMHDVVVILGNIGRK